MLGPRELETDRREPAGCGKHVARQPLGLPQTQTYARRCAALRSIRSAAARTEYRHQCLVYLAAYRAIGLNGTDIDACCLTFVALFPFRALRPLRALSAGLSLRTGNALDALRSLRSGGTLRSGITFRSRFSRIPPEK
jgi:hypothetical protein